MLVKPETGFGNKSAGSYQFSSSRIENWVKESLSPAFAVNHLIHNDFSPLILFGAMTASPTSSGMGRSWPSTTILLY
jgi:hypothetical protein